MRRLPVVVVGLLSGAVVGGLLDGIVWPGSALALFRPQLALLLFTAALVALALRARRAAIAGIAIAGLGGALLIPALRDPETEPPPAGSRTVKVLTLNLWHRNDDVAAVSELIRRERPDIVALLELTPRWSRALAPALRPYRTRAVEPREGSIGIGLYARAHLGDPRLLRPVAGGRRAIEARLELTGRAGALLVAHPPGVLLPGAGGAHERELAAIGEWARRHGPLSVVCGDLNAAPWTRSLRDARAKGALRPVFPGGALRRLVAGAGAAPTCRDRRVSRRRGRQGARRARATGGLGPSARACRARVIRSSRLDPQHLPGSDRRASVRDIEFAVWADCDRWVPAAGQRSRQGVAVCWNCDRTVGPARAPANQSASPATPRSGRGGGVQRAPHGELS